VDTRPSPESVIVKVQEGHRREVGVPQDTTFHSKWEMALTLIDIALAWELPKVVFTADAGYGNITEFGAALAERQLLYEVSIQNTTSIWVDAGNLIVPSLGRRGRPRRRPLNKDAPMSVAEVSQGLLRDYWQRITWREGTKGPKTRRFAVTRVLPSHSYQHGGDKERTLWLLMKWS
jgi:SRSO17 transposase